MPLIYTLNVTQIWYGDFESNTAAVVEISFGHWSLNEKIFKIFSQFHIAP